MELAMVDDAIMPIEQAKISAHDRGVCFGDGVYEVVRLCNGRLFEMQLHMARFQNSLKEMDMLDRVDLQVVRERVERCIAQAKTGDATLYFHITRGVAARAHDYSDGWRPSFLLTLRHGGGNRPKQVTAITYPDLRWKRCDIKTLNLVANVMAKHAAVKAGAFEAALVDDQGLITESPCASILIIKDGALWAPPLKANILPGITRALLLKWAPEVGLKPREESFTVPQALTADEMIITSTSYEVMTITHLDGNQISDGRRGKYAERLGAILIQAIR